MEFGSKSHPNVSYLFSTPTGRSIVVATAAVFAYTVFITYLDEIRQCKTRMILITITAIMTSHIA